MMKKKVLVAMSGGVDSSVSAFLLKEKGFEVKGITMCLGVKGADGEKPRCCGPQAIDDAKKVCDKLKIPHYVMDFSQDLEEKVIRPFVEEYRRGRTPNPCINCNRFMKFGTLLEKALCLGFDYLATGHYAKIESKNGRYLLKRAYDKVKDQTYFLYPLRYEYLKHILFPLGNFTKERVRRIAKEANLPIFDKPQSQDICFILEKDYHSFLKKRIKEIRPGSIVDLKGKVLGQHRGICFYTIGQREGLGISSKRPLYVISIDAKRNRLTVGERKDLKGKGLFAGKVNFLAKDFPEEAFAKIRYAHKETKCKIFYEDNKVKVIFEQEQEAITPGQSVVFYSDKIVLGGGIIEQVLKRYPSED